MDDGIILAKPTGRVLADDKQYIEVILPHSTVFARPCYTFGSMFAPSEEYLSKYKDEIFIALMKEQGNTNYIWIGIVPIEGKLSEQPDNFPRSGYFRTENFIVRINDETKTCEIVERDADKKDVQSIILQDGKVVINSKNIKFVDAEATEQVVLGNELNTNINSLITELKKVATLLGTFAGTQAGASVATLAPLAPGFTKLGTDMSASIGTISAISAKLTKHLSTNVKTK